MILLKVDPDSPKVRIPPPLFLIASIAIGKTLDSFIPRPFLAAEYGTPVGWTLVAIGISAIIASFFTFRRAQTAIEPWKTSSHLITTGLFAVSRNPIYLAFLVIGSGVAMIDDNLWIFLLQLPLAFALYWCVVRLEERYLAGKFGDQYRDYAKRVRRWI